MVYLCFDFGTSSWGCAVGDRLSGTAQAIEAVPAQKGDPNWDSIRAMVTQWRPEALVIGYPLKASGERFKLTDLVDKAVVALEKHFSDIPVYKADERLSTVQAREHLFAQKGRKGLEKGLVDSESARIILQQWFESQAFDSGN